MMPRMQAASRWWVVVLVAAAALLGAAAPAHAFVVIGGDATQRTGQIGFHVWGSGVFDRVDVAETVGGRSEPVRTLQLPVTQTPEGIPFSGTFYGDVLPWRCDRVRRTFTATGYRADGTVERADFELRTPSCRERLALVVPRRTQRPGRTVTVRVRDRWGLGDTGRRLCVTAPGGARDCRAVTVPPGAATARVPLRLARTGRYRVTLRAPQQRLRAVVASGVPAPRVAALPRIVTTGDSLMQGVAAELADDLRDRADVRDDVRVGSGMSKDSGIPADWTAVPGQQVRRDRPAATIVFLGTNEGWPMRMPARKTAECCGPAYVTEYARRARRAMRTYLQGTRGAVVWINVPASRGPARTGINAAVNAALARAVRGLPRARLLDADALFTPGHVYRETMLDRGREVRVRQSDGVHLSTAGAAIAARAVVDELERLGVV